MELFKFILKYLKKYKYRYLAGIITLFIVDFMGLIIPKITGTIIDGLTLGTINIKGISFCIIWIVIVGLTISIGRFFWRYFIIGAAPHQHNTYIV